MLIWAKSCPNLADIRAAIAQNSDLLDAIAKYVNSVTCSSCSLDGAPLRCTSCNSTQLQFVPLDSVPRPDHPLRQSEAVPHIVSCESCSTPLSAGDLLRNAAVDLLRRRADAGIAEAAVLLQQYQTCLDSFMARPGPSPDTDPQTANAATVLMPVSR